MSAVIISWSIMISQTAIALAMVLATTRILRGPRAQDRVLALDALYVCGMLELVLFGMRTGTSIYFETALIIGILGFVSTVALGKFLMRGEVIE